MKSNELSGLQARAFAFLHELAEGQHLLTEDIQGYLDQILAFFTPEQSRKILSSLFTLGVSIRYRRFYQRPPRTLSSLLPKDPVMGEEQVLGKTYPCDLKKAANAVMGYLFSDLTFKETLLFAYQSSRAVLIKAPVRNQYFQWQFRAMMRAMRFVVYQHAWASLRSPVAPSSVSIKDPSGLLALQETLEGRFFKPHQSVFKDQASLDRIIESEADLIAYQAYLNDPDQDYQVDFASVVDYFGEDRLAWQRYCDWVLMDPLSFIEAANASARHQELEILIAWAERFVSLEDVPTHTSLYDALHVDWRGVEQFCPRKELYGSPMLAESLHVRFVLSLVRDFRKRADTVRLGSERRALEAFYALEMPSATFELDPKKQQQELHRDLALSESIWDHVFHSLCQGLCYWMGGVAITPVKEPLGLRDVPVSLEELECFQIPSSTEEGVEIVHCPYK